MKKSLFLFSFLMLFFANVIYSQTLPTKIKSYLDSNYKGWKIPKMSGNCGDLKSIATGDFDGNGKTDYVLKISTSKKGFMLAFINQNNDFKPFLLHKFELSEIKDVGVLIYKKGEKYSLGEPGEENAKYITLKNDAPYDGVCESDSGGIHVYKNGKFIDY